MRYDHGMRRRIGMRECAIIGLTLAVGLLLGVAVTGAAEKARTERQLRDMAARSYYELIDRMDDLQVNMSKLLIASTPESNIVLLGEIYRQADEAAACLSQLPAVHPDLADTMRFLNQTAGFSRSLAERTAHGLPLTRDNLELVSHLHDACSQVRENVSRIDPEALDVSAADPNAWYDSAEGDVPYHPSVSYPTMIYDGPFSDGLDGQRPRGLGGEEIGSAAAIEIALSFLGDVSRGELAVRQVDAGKIPGFMVTSEYESLFVTREGGEVLWYLDGRAAPSDMYWDDARCLEAAAGHLRTMGMTDMDAVWSGVYDDMMVIHFAPRENGVLLYPDMVKLRIRRSDGSLAAWDASEYWMNHRERETFAPVIGREEARDVLSDQLRVEESGLCLIPTEGGGERLCWEFRASFGERTYLVYIDAVTGAEANIFILIETDRGLMVM